MSKYNLSDLLNEISNSSRIGFLETSAKELVAKMEEIEASGIDVDRYDGKSEFGKTNIEFHVHPEGRDEPDASFTVYDYKFGFNPMDEDHFMNEYPFRVGGRGKIALAYAKKFIDVKPEITEEEDKKPKLPQSIKDKEDRDAEIEAKKAKGMMKEDDVDPYYDLRRIKQEVRQQINAFDKGIIDGDDLVNALEEIIFGRTAPGMMNESVPAVEKMETMKREIRLQLDSFDKGIIDGDDLANAMEEIVFGRRAPGVNTDDDFEREQRMQMSMREEDAIEDEPVTEDMFGPAKFLKSKGISDKMISDFMKMHSKDVIGASEDEIMDEFENFRSVNYDYIDENLQNHFARFLKDYQ